MFTILPPQDVWEREGFFSFSCEEGLPPRLMPTQPPGIGPCHRLLLALTWHAAGVLLKFAEP